MSDVTAQPSHPAIETEAPGLQHRNLWAGSRLLVSSTIFFFLPFVFAWVYLASLNTSGLWRPRFVEPPVGWGLVILIAVVVSAGLVGWARGELAEGRGASSRLLALAGLVAGLVAVVVQGIEYAKLGFGPTDGGFASVFVGWSGLYAAVLLGAMIWLEIVVASAFRRKEHATDDAKVELDSVGFYLTFLAGLGALTFGFLYLL